MTNIIAKEIMVIYMCPVLSIFNAGTFQISVIIFLLSSFYYFYTLVFPNQKKKVVNFGTIIFYVDNFQTNFS